MDIYPQDLGKANERGARRRREYFHRAPLTAAGVSPAEQHTAMLPLNMGVLALIFASIIPLIFGMGVIQALDIGGSAALLVTFGMKFARRKRKKHAVPTGEQALTAQEIAWLRADATDPLQSNFCDLTLTAITSPSLPDGLSEAHLRAVLRCLGEAVHDVPELSFKLTPQDAEEMVSVAGRLVQDAQAEPDPVVADSLRRRADALRGQADTVHRAQTLLRRNQTLRLELFDQISALRTGIAAAAIGQRDGARGLTELAESIQSVAAEAAAVTGARAEVDSYLHPEASAIPSPVSINRGQY